MEDRIATLRRSARPRKRKEPARVESPDIELRMCKPADDPAIDRLAALSEVPVPYGRLVVALLDGKLVAALPLNGEPVVRDPFVKTAQLVHLLEVRAEQLREPARARRSSRACCGGMHRSALPVMNPAVAETIEIDVPRRGIGSELTEALAARADAEIVDSDERCALHVRFAADERERLLDDAISAIEAYCSDRMLPLVVQRANGGAVVRPPAD